MHKSALELEADKIPRSDKRKRPAKIAPPLEPMLKSEHNQLWRPPKDVRRAIRYGNELCKNVIL